MSQELENSLRQAIENYFNQRLSAIGEQLSALQAEFNDAFERLRDSARTDAESTEVSAMVASHLQAAREQQLALQTASAEPASDVSSVTRGLREIEKQDSQAGILTALLKNSAAFADRVALFVIKNDRAIGWRVCEAADRENLEAIPSITLSLDGDSIISRVAKSGFVATTSDINSADRGLADQLGGDPHEIASAPIIVRNKVVAVLYADSAWPHRDAIQLDGLETLTRFAGLAVSLIAAARSVESAETAKVEVTREATAAEAMTPARETERESPAPVPTTFEAAERAQPSGEQDTQSSGVSTEVTEQPEAPLAETSASVTQQVIEPARDSAPFASQYFAPLGDSRRYGVSEPELPIEVGDEERRLHNDARRFARLLVSEIKLYNERKVNEGRSSSDIYERLREDIDRSRQMYEKRVAPPVAARHDYFHQELVNTLAEGDPGKLGASYPGAAVAVS